MFAEDAALRRSISAVHRSFLPFLFCWCCCCCCLCRIAYSRRRWLTCSRRQIAMAMASLTETSSCRYELTAVLWCADGWISLLLVLIHLPCEFRYLQLPKSLFFWRCLQYRRVSHGLGWPANAILFLTIVKGNQLIAKHVGTNSFKYNTPNKLNLISLLRHRTCFARSRYRWQPAG